MWFMWFRTTVNAYKWAPLRSVSHLPPTCQWSSYKKFKASCTYSTQSVNTMAAPNNSVYRLPTAVKPTHYGVLLYPMFVDWISISPSIDLFIKTDLEKLTFDGLATIQ